ncbi:MAG: dihydroneopterin aldolase [Bacteroidales bacterium]|nr:dihydroneopterin aldolase [Bacteroidales bacterium]
MGTIELEGMEFTAYHGCLESERRDGNLFIVDFSAEYDIRDAVVTDCLEDTLDYGAVYEIIAKEMAVPSNLLEHVAGRIVKSLDIAFPCLGSFSVRVSKRNPPVSGPVQWSRVTISHRKQK